MAEETKTPVTTPANPASDSGMVRQKPTNISNFLNNAPVMTQVRKGELPGPEGGIPAPVKEEGKPASGEGVKEPEKKPLVEGPAAKKTDQGGKPESTAQGEKPKPGETKGVSVEPGQTIKIGDLEYPAEQWAQFAKDYANDRSWQAKNTKRSQIVNAFTDAQLNEIAPYVLAQRKLPENFKQELDKLVDLPKEFTVQDADGYDIKIKTSDIPADLLNALKSQIAVQMFPEFIKVTNENSELKQQTEQVTQHVTAQNIENGSRMAVEFMKQYPECAITLYPDDRLEVVLADIHKAGPDHPEFENGRRLAAVLMSINDGVYENFDDAAKSMFGESKIKKEAAEQIAKNQAEGKPEEPQAKVPRPGGGAELLGKIKARSQGARYQHLGRQ